MTQVSQSLSLLLASRKAKADELKSLQRIRPVFESCLLPVFLVFLVSRSLQQKGERDAGFQKQMATIRMERQAVRQFCLQHFGLPRR